MTNVVYNGCYGGFSLSQSACDRYWELKGEPAPSDWWPDEIERDDPHLVQVVLELGLSAGGNGTNLMIRNIEAGSLYILQDYDGWESVVLQDEFDWKVA